MKLIKLTIILIGILIIGCNQSENKANSDQTTVSTDTDKEQIQQLIRKAYEWHETKSSKIDFSPKETKDSLYSELDLIQHKKSLIELNDSGYFTEDFLKNYDKIAQTINNDLKAKTAQWYVGDMPTFGNGTYPWCNCQDNPDKYWDKLTIKNLVFDKDIATFAWTWGDKFEYRVKAKKVNDTWKIDYLQGFDFEDFFNQE
jgi:hypothetical protein